MFIHRVVLVGENNGIYSPYFGKWNLCTMLQKVNAWVYVLVCSKNIK